MALLAPLGWFLAFVLFAVAQIVQGMPDIGQTLATLFEELGIASIIIGSVL